MRAKHLHDGCLWVAAAVILSGCGRPPAPATAPANQAAPQPVKAAPTLVIDQNGLFFDDVPPKVGEPLELSMDVLRGRWVVFRAPRGQGDNMSPASLLTVTFGSGNRPAWTLNESGTTVTNPDGDAEILIDGYRIGMVASAMAWGWNDDRKSGWMASPWAGNPPFEKSLAFELLRDDLLRCRGDIALRADLRIGFDVILVRVPEELFGEPIPNVSFSDSELSTIPLENDPIVAPESAADFQGTWIAQSEDRKTTLTIADHRVLQIKQKLDVSPAPAYVYRKLLQFNPAEQALEIQYQEISSATTGPLDDQDRGPVWGRMKLTQSGRLLYLHSPVRAVVFTRQPDGSPQGQDDDE